MVVAACASSPMPRSMSTRLGGNDPVWFLFSGSANEAPQFLSSLVTAMITMATLAISITMVVLTLAAQQLGPRLIRSFMSDRRTQAVARPVRRRRWSICCWCCAAPTAERSAVPNLAVTGGTVLVLICVATLLLFVHHLARSIVADNVIDRVGAQLDGDIAAAAAEEDGRAAGAAAGHQAARRAGACSRTAAMCRRSISQPSSHAAAEADAVVELDDPRRAARGAGTHSGVMSRPRKPPGDALCQAIQNAVLVGRERTGVQDLEFSIRQLVEIALRALSPGINDPYTAIAMLDRLTLSISIVDASRQRPRASGRTTTARPRLVASGVDVRRASPMRPSTRSARWRQACRRC